MIGRVIATEQKPSTPHQFVFWTARDAAVGIGSIVRAQGEGRTVFGVVTDAFAYSDLGTPMDAVFAADGDPVSATEPSRRSEIRLYQTAVLRHDPEEPLQAVPLGEVHLATDADVATALRMDAYTEGDKPTAVPVGLYAAGGLEAPIFVDSEFVLGPEAAHLNITGVSGLATKTSAVEFFLTSIFQKFPAHKGRIAAVCFNVKGPDLCFLDQPGTLTDEDRRIYQRLGLEAKPFERVRYFAPLKPDGVNLNTLRTNPELAPTEPLVWGLREVLDYTEVVLNRDDVDAKADACIDFLADRVVGKEFHDEIVGKTFTVRSFTELDQFFRDIFGFLETVGRGTEIWRTHHVATLRKIRNRLGNISTRSKGLVTDGGEVSDLPWGQFEDRTVYVVDVAGVDPLAQDLVFARIVSKLREHLERRELGVEHIVVFVDELNKYAPQDGPDGYVRKMLLDLSERGRYLGLVLFSAQQFRSQVHKRVVGNAGTSIFGRLDADELATAGYGILSPAVKAKLASLPKGELMVRHPHFTQPIFVRFPRPAVLSGREGIERFPPEADVPFEDAVIRRLRAIGGSVTTNRLKDLISGRDQTDVVRALHATLRARPNDVTAFFTKCLGREIAVRPITARISAPVAPLRTADDPYR